jgi:gliding motility-associated-like protein
MVGFSQAFHESFEADIPPAPDWNLGTTGLGSAGHWAIFDNGVGLVQSWTINTAVTTPITVCDGTRSAYINRENIGALATSQDFLATPLITIPANGELRFLTRTTISGDQLTKYKIMWAPASASQNNPAAYTLIQEYTEVNLTATFNVCEEKAVSLAIHAGEQGYIAFVREFSQPDINLNGDRWLVDNIRIDEACIIPTVLAAGLITQTSAQLSWTAGVGQNQWEIQIVPFEDPFPTTGGSIIIGANPYTATQTTAPAATNFAPSTQYKYRVRAVCSSGFISDWSDPFSFTMSSPGLTCASPVVIGSLPYCTTDNTANYGDSTDVPQPAACAGTATNYMTGNDVFYSYTPTVTGAVSIAMTPTATWSGIFVYDGCANVGLTCVAGVANTNSNIREIPSLLVEAGHQYIIVISTNAAPQTTGYELCIQQLNCAPPNALSALSTGPTSANLSWGNPGAATSWEVFVQPTGASIPTTAGTTANTNTNFGVTTMNDGTPLVLGCYQYWVRAACGDGTFSPWAGPYQFCTTTCSSGCNYSLVMTDSFGDGWNGNTMTLTQGASSTTIGSTFTTGVGPITIPVTLCDGAFTLTWNAGGNFAGEVGIAIVNNFGQTIFYHAPGANQQGQLLYTGTVDCANPSCLPPTAIAAATPTTTGATISWTPPAGPTPVSWEIYAVPTGGPAPDASSIPIATVPGATTSTVIVVPLADTNYTVWVRAVCSTAGPNPWSTATATFTTLPTCPKPTALLVTLSDLNAVTVNWTPGGTETAWQVIIVADGAPVPAANDPNWVDAPNHPFTIPNLTSGTNYDVYVRAVCSPTDSSTPAGPLNVTTAVCAAVNQCLYTFTMVDSFGDSWNGNTMSVIQNGVVVATLTGPTNEDNQTPITVQIALCHGIPFELFWNTGGAFANEVGVSITSFLGDNLFTHTPNSSGNLQGQTLYTGTGECIPPTCLKPTNVVVSNISLNSAVITWQDNNAPAATQWEIIVLPAADPAPLPGPNANAILVTENPYTYINLDPATPYTVYVRAVCSDTDSSFWSVGTDFNTVVCLPSNLCEYQFEMWDSFGDSWNGNTMTVTQNGIPMATLTGPTNADDQNHIFQIVPLCNNIPFELVWNTGGAFATEVGVGIINTLDETIYTHTPGTSQQGETLFSGTVNCVPLTCPKPVQLTATQISSTTALLGWTEAATATQWQIYVVPFGTTAPVFVFQGSPAGVNPILVSGLTPGTQYTYYVRAVCSATDQSNWSLPFNFSTLPANDECSGAIMVPVNSNSSCNQSTPGTVSGATASSQANSCAGASDDDVWFQFVATNSYHNVALQGITGGADLNFAVYSGTCGVMTLVQCYTDNTGAVNGLTPGNIYYVRVWSVAATPQTASFTLCITTQSTCDNASNACVNTVYTNTTGVANLGQIGCLFTSPNPRFFIIEVIASGPINYFLQQSSPGSATPNLDVDYAAWGPFASEDVMCNGIPLPSAPLTGQTTGCSYSAAPTETFNIPNAQAGQFYVILITNFSNQAGVITLTQTNAGQAGAGSTNCCPEANFTYPQIAYCTTDPNPTPTVVAGSLLGTFSSVPAGITFVDTATGQINLATSTPGVYVVRNTLLANDNCDERHFDYTLTISAPVNATITYPSPATFCSGDTNLVTVNFSGTPGGTYSALPLGLFINPVTGTVDPSQSAAGIYTVNYNILSAGACAAVQPSTTIEILPTPDVLPISDVTACDSYTLPALAVGNYFDGPGGTGNAYNANDAITSSMTMYAYADISGCTDEESFDITINPTPVLDPVSDLTSCTSYILPTLTVGDYYTGPGGTGVVLADGTEISTNQTIYIYATNGACSSELSFTITFGALTADVLNDVTVCDSYVLPGLSANNAYWTGPNGTGTMWLAGQSVTSGQSFYIWASQGSCTDQSTFIVTVNQTPVLAAVSDVTHCGAYTLPVLSVGSYYNGPDATLGQVASPVSASQQVYVYAQTGTDPNCFAQASFQVTINDTPEVDELNDVDACNSYTLPGLTVGAYWTQSGGTGTQLPAGTVITQGQTIYIWSADGTCSDESDFVVGITDSPAFTIESGCQGSQYVLTVVPTNGFDAATAEYTWTSASGGVITGTGQSVVVSGADTYSVSVQVGDCPTAQSLVVDGTGCLIQKGISPNGDGNNDYFDLEGQNVSKLQIFNRYGMVVYKKDNYSNQWYGQSDDGEELPDGTYYYVIDRAQGEARTGWIYINRERN